MFNIEWNGRDSLFEETEKNLKKIEGIEEFYKLTKELYGNDKGIADIISTEDWKYAAETRLRDKFIKIKIRYKGD